MSRLFLRPLVPFLFSLASSYFLFVRSALSEFLLELSFLVFNSSCRLLEQRSVDALEQRKALFSLSPERQESPALLL